MKLINFIILLLLGLACTTKENPPAAPARLQTEYLKNPLGIDTEKPRFTWEVNDPARGAVQTAYQIIVSAHEDSLQQDKGELWDSGKVPSAKQVNIAYEGKPLSPATRYFWKVKTWNAKGEASPYSETAWFETALLNESEWQAQWIGDGREAPQKREDFYDEIPAPIFRKEFSLEKAVRRARLYITGLGYYEAYLNGTKVGDQVLDPGWTNYGKRILYSTYDITEQIKQGENAIGVMLGNGWYNPLPLGLFRVFNLRDFLTIGQPKFIAQLQVTFEDGTSATVLSDTDWKWSTGPILKNNVYLGEVYDARKRQEGWNTPGFDDSQWQQVVEVNPPDGKLVAQMVPPIRITREIEPVSVTQSEPGVYVFDLGQNFAGWINLKLEGEAGTKVKMLYGELLYENGRVNGMTTVAGHIKEIWNLSGGPGAPKTAYQEDTYIMKGGGEETFQQKFGFQAFRYVEVSGYEGELTTESLDGLRLNSDLQKVSAFECSNPLFNKVQEITEWTMLSNVFSIQSDCPGREKFGYGADIVTAAEAYIYNYDMANFYRKTVRDFQDDVRPNGGLPETAPYNGIDTEGFGEGTGPIGWQLAHPFVMQQLYKYYGDKQIIEEQYPTVVNMLEFLRTQAKDNYIEHGIGDHVSISYKAVPLTSTAFYYHIAKLTAEFAGILNKPEDQQKYETLANDIKQSFIKRFYHPETGVLDSAITQANQVFGLYYDLVPEEDREKVLQVLVDDIMETNKGHISTGIFGTKMIWNVLQDEDRNDVAFTMANQKDFPGYGYMIENGATTLWEHWDESRNQNSKNHPMFGSVSEWFYKAILGINQAPDAVAFDKLIIAPNVVGDLTWAKGSYHSVRGKIVSDWKVENGEFIFTLTLPANTTATVRLPAKDLKSAFEGDMLLKESEEITGVKMSGNRAVFEVGGGTYRFKTILPESKISRPNSGLPLLHSLKKKKQACIEMGTEDSLRL